ncbi:MAG: outer membrane protein transport protein [Deltaproteobacteria bacterium]
MTAAHRRSKSPRRHRAARFALGASLACASTLAPPALAGGYFAGSYGARAIGRGGAFSVKADDLTAVTWNPAGLSRIQGTLLHAGNRLVYDAHSFTRATTLDWGNTSGGIPPLVEFPEVDNELRWQALNPLFGVASNLGVEDWMFALSAHAPPGIARKRFPTDGGQRYLMLERQVLMLQYSASAAFQPLEQLGIGLSLHWISVPSLEYQLVVDANQFPGDVNPVSSELDMRARLSGSDLFTPNATVGAWYRPAEFLELGLALQVIPATIRADSKLSIEPLSPEIDDRVELRRDGARANDVSLSFPLPVTARAGVRYRHLEGAAEVFDVELDIGFESWSRVRRFSVDTNDLTATLLAQRLDIGSIDVEKHWHDTWSVQLGGDFALLPEHVTLRGGAFYETASGDPSYAHVDFASGAQLGAALGASVFVQGLELALAYEYRQQPRQSVSEGGARVLQEVPGSQCAAPFTDPDTCHPQYLGRAAPAVNAGTYRYHSQLLSLDVLCRF